MPRRRPSKPLSFELSTAVDEFLSECAFTLSGRTHEWYAYHLGVFVTWARDHSIADLAAITPEILRVYLNDQKAHTYSRKGSSAVQSLSLATLQSRQRSVSRFLEWCVEQDYLVESPMRKVKAIRGEQRAREAFTLEESMRLLKAARNADGWLRQRDTAIVGFLLGTGARADELLTLTNQHFDWNTGRVLVNGKGRKDRRIPMGKGVQKAIREYLRGRPASSHANIWLTTRGTAMSHGTLWAMLKALGEYADVEHCHPHRFRHTFAVEWYKANRDIMALKNLLGHSKVETTQRYLSSLGINYGTDGLYPMPDEWILRPLQ
jgi:site-specific recombinase XerD